MQTETGVVSIQSIIDRLTADEVVSGIAPDKRRVFIGMRVELAAARDSEDPRRIAEAIEDATHTIEDWGGHTGDGRRYRRRYVAEVGTYCLVYY